MDSWERFDETSLPDKEAFYSRLNMENIKMMIIDMPKEYSKNLTIKIWVVIMICMLKVIHYCLLIYLRIVETNMLKYMN